MSNISSTTVIIVGLLAIIIIFAFRQTQAVSKYRGLLTKVCFVIVAIMIIFAIFKLFFKSVILSGVLTEKFGFYTLMHISVF